MHGVRFTRVAESGLDEFLAAAKDLGAEVLHEARVWPEYTEPPVSFYYAAFARDPDGNNVEACYAELIVE